MQEPLINLLAEVAKADIRHMAVSNRIAYMIFEVSIYYTLITAPDNFNIKNLLIRC